MGIHYAKRWPSISYAYGLFEGENLVGCVTFGTPPSSTLRNGVAGKENAGHVLELNRLVLKNNNKNEASFLVANAIKQLPKKKKIIVSYTDSQQNHIGFVYQACNFLYCGLSAKRTDWKIKGKEHLHNTTVTDEFRGVKNRAQAMKNKYGDDFYLKPRPRKHRYVYICGPKLWKRGMKKQIKYKQENYPK